MEFDEHSPSPLTLSSLPTEILALVLGKFCLHCREPQEPPFTYAGDNRPTRVPPSWCLLDIQVLYSTCLVSRRFRDIAQPILHHAFVLGHPSHPWRNRPYSWYGRLNSFLRTVVARRDLAVMVRELRLPDSLLSNVGVSEAEDTLSEAARVLGIDLSKFLDPFRDLAERYPSKQYWPAGSELTVMLLSCLPNLVRLYLPCAWPRRFIPAAALSAAGVSGLGLRTIDLIFCGSYPTEGLASMFEMSFTTLRTLSIHGYHSTNSLPLPAGRLPNLRNLCLIDNLMNGSDLKTLLSYCVGLETFIHDSVAIVPEINPSDLIKDLSKEKETLQTLRLRIEHLPIGLESLCFEPIPSLRSFHVLRDVIINIALIYDQMNNFPEDPDALFHLLPPSIVWFGLSDTVCYQMPTSLANGLVRLAEAASHGQFPSLKKVKYYTREDSYYYGFEDKHCADDHGLTEKFDNAGVHFGFQTWPFKRIDGMMHITLGSPF